MARRPDGRTSTCSCSQGGDPGRPRFGNFRPSRPHRAGRRHHAGRVARSGKLAELPGGRLRRLTRLTRHTRSNGRDFPWHDRQLGHPERSAGTPHYRPVLRLFQRKRSTDGRRAVVAAGGSVAYTGEYVADDVFRFRPGRPRLPRRRVASGTAARPGGRRGWSWPAGVRARRPARPPGRGRGVWRTRPWCR